MKNRNFYRVMITALIGMSLLSGCSDKKEESKAAYRDEGIAYMELGDYEKAILSFETALSQKIGAVTKNDLDISYYKAAAQCASGDTESAIATYSAIIDLEEDAYEAYYLRACLYCKQRNMEAAKADFINAVKYSKKEYDLYLNIYDNLAAVGDLEAGEEYLRQALEVKGNEAGDAEYRGRICYLLGDYDTALTELEKALEKGSTSANLYLAKIFDEMGDETSAQEYYKTYIASVPTDSAALNELGEMMMEKGQFAEAVTYFELASKCPTISNKRVLMHNLIVAYEYNGNFYKAWEVVQEYVKLFPDDAEAQREYIFLKNRQMEEEVSETESTETIEGTDNSENTENSENTNNSETTGNSESTNNSETTGNSESTNNSGSTGNSESTNNSGSTGNSESTNNSGSTGNSESTNNSGNTGNSESTNDVETTGNSENANNAESTGNSDSANNTGNSESTNNSGNTGNSESTNNSGNTGNSDSENNSGNTGNSDSANNTGNTGNSDSANNSGNTGNSDNTND